MPDPVVTPEAVVVPDGEGKETAKETQKKAISFDPDQREWIETHGDEMFGKGYGRAEKIYKTQITEAQAAMTKLAAELETLKKGVQPPVVKEPVAEKAKEPVVAESEELKRMRAQLEELQGGIKTLREQKEEAVTKLSAFDVEQKKMRLRTEFLEAIPEGTSFFDNDEVFNIVSGQLDTVEGKTIVKNPKTGMPRLNRELTEPMTLSEYLAEFAEKKPHHVRASDAGGGTGAGEQRRIPAPADKLDVDSMTPAQFEAFLSQVKAGKFSA